MDTLTKAMLAHQLGKDVEEKCGPASVCLQTHYDKPCFSVCIGEAAGDSPLFEVNGDRTIKLRSPRGYQGDLELAKEILIKALGLS